MILITTEWKQYDEEIKTGYVCKLYLISLTLYIYVAFVDTGNVAVDMHGISAAVAHQLALNKLTAAYVGIVAE